MIKFYILFRLLQIIGCLKEVSHNIQLRVLLAGLVVINRNILITFTVIGILTLLSIYRIYLLSLPVVIFLSIIIAMFPALPNKQMDSGYVIVDKINTNYVLWSESLPLELSILKTYDNVEIFDRINISSPLVETINSPYLNSLGVTTKITGQINQKQQTLFSWLTKLKNTLSSNIDSNLDVKNSSLVKGFIFGSASLTDDSLKEDLKVLGLSHIVSVSGFNFTIILNVILALNAIISRRLLNIASLIFFILFYLFIGALNASALRAMVMILLSGIAIAFGYKVRKVNLIILAIFAINILSQSILTNLSFQLSILAVIGLTYSSTQISNKLNINNAFLKEGVSVSIAAFLSTLPIIIANFENVSWAGLITNIIFLPFVPILMLLGFFSSLFTNNSFSDVISILANLISGAFIKLAGILSEIKFFEVKRDTLTIVLAIGMLIYLILDFKTWSRKYGHWRSYA